MITKKLGVVVVLGIALLLWSWYEDGAFDRAPADPAQIELDADTAEQLAAIPARDETSLRTYDRDEWKHWTQVPDTWNVWTDGRDGCDTREAVLIRDGWKVTADRDTCEVTGGTWRTRYDQRRHTSPDTIQIDHRVPLAEAFASGGARWSPEKKERFANDPLLVVAATDVLNQSKGDGDLAEWLPDFDRCAYVAVWVTIKDTYGLSMDPAEKRVARRFLTDPECSKGGGK